MRNYEQFMHAKELVENHQLDEAIKLYEELILDEPDSIYIKYDYCKAIIDYNSSYNDVETLAKLRKYLKEINDRQALHELARLERRCGNIDDSIRVLNKIVKFYPQDNGSCLSDLGKIEYFYGDANKAREHLLDSNKEVSDIEAEINYLYLAKVEGKEGNFKKAHQYLDKLKDSTTKRKQYALLERLYLYMKSKNYKKAYAFYINNKIAEAYDFQEHVCQIGFYLKHQLGLLNIKNVDELDYFETQLLSYNEEEAMKHATYHLEEMETKRMHGVFYDTIDLRKLFEEAKAKIQDAKLSSFSLVDKYIIKTDEDIATINGEKSNTLGVATLLNTKSIISIYPMVQLKWKKEEDIIIKEESYQKRKSQIEKFNERYGKK